MINHRGGILIFGQILNFGKNRKFEIFNPSSNPNFGSLTLNPNFAILANFGSLLNLVLPNLDRSRRQLSKNTKIVKFEQNLVPKFLISQILWVLGYKIAIWKLSALVPGICHHGPPEFVKRIFKNDQNENLDLIFKQEIQILISHVL